MLVCLYLRTRVRFPPPPPLISMGDLSESEGLPASRLPRPAVVTLESFDATDSKVRILLSEYKSAGHNQYDTSGARLAQPGAPQHERTSEAL